MPRTELSVPPGLEDMEGGTFTVTNPGGIGGTGFTPIINHPQVAILDAARAARVPVVSNIESATEDHVLSKTHPGCI